MPVPSTVHESPYEVTGVNLAEVQSDNILQAKATPVFHLAHHPDNWEIGLVQTGEKRGKPVLERFWLPEMQEIPVKPGVNMCRTIGKDEKKEAAYSGQLLWLANRGQIAIPMDAIVGETQSYIAQTPCQHPRTKTVGVRHFDIWSSPKPTKSGKAVKFWRDPLAYNAWRLELVKHGWTRPDGTTGRLPDLDTDIVVAKIDRVQYHLNRKEAETGLPDRAYKLEVEKREELVKAHTGAKPVFFEGTTAVPVADYSTELIAALSYRVKGGEAADKVLAEFPGLSDKIVQAVHAATPKAKPITKTVTDDEKKGGK